MSRLRYFYIKYLKPRLNSCSGNENWMEELIEWCAVLELKIENAIKWAEKTDSYAPTAIVNVLRPYLKHPRPVSAEVERVALAIRNAGYRTRGYKEYLPHEYSLYRMGEIEWNRDMDIAKAALAAMQADITAKE